MREILSCIVEKFNGFRIVAIEQEKKLEKSLDLSISYTSLSKKMMG